ncbi:MAG: leucine-rich repeat protein [Oscillospiraceae bacterium]|nr:leucine-rich repeat protein [Oscillospiraceae bacterium]
METISGLSNWRLIIRREENGITVLRALTCDKKAVLPDELFGLPVRALEDHALAAGAKPAEGEEVLVLGGTENGDWDNRKITELTLPRFLRQFGNYAFMNLRSMETLRLYDDLSSVGSAGFMNCRSFSRLELRRSAPQQGPALAALVKSLQQELDVTILETDGSILRLIFPEYIESYTENNAAHHFELKIMGGGYAYHSVFRDKTLSLSDYDALWPAYLAQEHNEDSALRLAFSRLRCPIGLSERAEERYAAYLRENIGRALSAVLQEKDMQGLRMLLDLGSFATETLDAALRESRSLQMTEATAILLEKRRTHPAAGRMKTFEL